MYADAAERALRTRDHHDEADPHGALAILDPLGHLPVRIAHRERQDGQDGHDLAVRIATAKLRAATRAEDHEARADASHDLGTLSVVGILRAYVGVRIESNDKGDRIRREIRTALTAARSHFDRAQ